MHLGTDFVIHIPNRTHVDLSRNSSATYNQQMTAQHFSFFACNSHDYCVQATDIKSVIPVSYSLEWGTADIPVLGKPGAITAPAQRPCLQSRPPLALLYSEV